MANFLGVKEDENVIYADDSNVWQTGSTKEEVAWKLAEKVALFVDYTRRMGLNMNASKTQLLFSSCAGNVAETTVEVDGSVIHQGNTIELLGVRYDRKLSATPHVKALLTAVRQRASVVARLTNHLPRGRTCGSCHTGWSLESSLTRWRRWHARGWSSRTTGPEPGVGSKWP
jgi:Ser-tRNA(Ala) deacylase AlaX